MDATLLHGDLDLWILKARDLPNMDLFNEHLRRCFACCGVSSFTAAPRSTEAQSKALHKPKPITSDPYVTLSVAGAGATVAGTIVVPNDQNPEWNQHFLIPLAHCASHLEFQVKDDDFLGTQLIGTVIIPVHWIATGELIEGWFPIMGRSGKPPKPGSALLFKMQFFPLERVAKKLGVDRAYFGERSRGQVTLYQDAHVRDGELKEIELENGRAFRQEKCWEDICHAILDAHKLIYIVGWSIYDKVRLVREHTRELPNAGDMTLGGLLKYKSQEGVRVLLMVWDDKTSHDHLLLRTGGVMQTHDEETRKFFKHSSVICVMSPRYASSELSMVKQQVVGTLYTHHQKCLLVDTPASGNNRKITAFIGGLDLCDGRYDTPEHRLFADLDTVFLYDFHNPTFPKEEKKGPRQPWHDLHCKIEGPAAYDVLTNFEQRWRKATHFWVFSRFKRSSHWRDDALLKLDRISWILDPSSIVDDPSLPREDDPENWHVQIFRSIDSGSVRGFPKHIRDAEEQNLIFRKNLVIDKSIHTAYVNAIRSAEHFIYIENQYFIGSSYGWLSYTSPEADNLIPMELALKVASKIKAREHFAVYIIIPMWPEGLPNSGAVQEILFWQSRTMQMMYKIIGDELKSMNLEEAHPQDYLSFYCLGNREVPTGLGSQPSDVISSQKYRRFMVYVHAKGMIVDDEYVILGSANINQRSMDGSRDTEIAMGAYQPHQTWAMKQSHPRGQVYGYRMSLWQEHLGFLDELFNEPHNPNCVKLVNKIAQDNWTRYSTEQIVPLRGHLLKYPIKVEENGDIGPLPGSEFFPDVGGKVLGEAKPIPDNLTM
ncbi:phospholipase D delta-like isoform X2 [Asparagus officinalis]|uniref:phospholipase D delta-like isoform X2 n=1 Tax=Asparagus officinalis TaxID=4686 RepID=UPI00098E7141|nr:phospholipase D delta-like isoform X2 [Asparagus officinalis]